MKFEVLTTKPFERKLKQLAKKYQSIADDLENLEKELTQNPNLGIPLGKNCYKIRMVITSKAQGKSGGARIITYIRIMKKTVYLIDIYDKSEQASISDNELKMIIETLTE